MYLHTVEFDCIVKFNPIFTIIFYFFLTTFNTFSMNTVVVPIPQKGDSNNKANYRPVSCLVTASKVMEKVVSVQVTKFLEDNIHENMRYYHAESIATLSSLIVTTVNHLYYSFIKAQA